jgi:hypothetical protein
MVVADTENTVCIVSRIECAAFNFADQPLGTSVFVPVSD